MRHRVSLHALRLPLDIPVVADAVPNGIPDTGETSACWEPTTSKADLSAIKGTVSRRGDCHITVVPKDVRLKRCSGTLYSLPTALWGSCTIPRKSPSTTTTQEGYTALSKSLHLLLWGFQLARQSPFTNHFCDIRSRWRRRELVLSETMIAD